MKSPGNILLPGEEKELILTVTCGLCKRQVNSKKEMDEHGYGKCYEWHFPNPIKWLKKLMTYKSREERKKKFKEDLINEE